MSTEINIGDSIVVTARVIDVREASPGSVAVTAVVDAPEGIYQPIITVNALSVAHVEKSPAPAAEPEPQPEPAPAAAVEEVVGPE
jgi:hypothetical protein